MHHKKVVIWLYVHWGTEVKNVLAFERESFSVYNALILSYSIYDNKLPSVGFLGNVFSSMDVLISMTK